MICPNCGNENPDDVRFCTYCGAPADLAIGSPAEKQDARNAQAVRDPQAAIHEAYHNPYREPYQPTAPYIAPAAAAAAPDPYDEPETEESSLGFGNWFLAIFLTGIPVIGFIMLLIWSLSSKIPVAKRNWARAMLVWMILVTIVSVIAAVLFALKAETVVERMGGYY